MTQHDDSLEIGIGAGLDIPTALVVSECDDDESPRLPTGKPQGCSLCIVLVAVLVACGLVCVCAG